MAVIAVIGAGYGDEGKGLMVDHLVRTLPGTSLVIRHSGGAQASHTVVDGPLRHAFSHFGAGTFAGAKTYLARNFISNPIRFREEHERLLALGYQPDVYRHITGSVTTPIDMMINQMVERRRGADRHGSCGLGINETVTRFETIFFAYDLQEWGHGHRSDRLAKWRMLETWIERRLAALGITPTEEELDLLFDKDIRGRFEEDVDYMARHTCPANDITMTVLTHEFTVPGSTETHKPEVANIIYEGSQGLQLDEFSGNFPHVTRARTGTTHCVEYPLDDIVYVTRAYQTKHGAGPFEHEADMSSAFRVVDPTNVPNPNQGAMRYAPLDPLKLMEAIRRDANGRPFKLAVTCLDQALGDIPVITNGIVATLPQEEFLARLSGLVMLHGGTGLYRAYGPSSADVKGPQTP